MKNKLTTLSTIALGALGAIGGISLYSRKIRKQSVRSFLMEKGLLYSGAKKLWHIFGDEKSGYERLLKASQYNPHPSDYLDEAVYETEKDGMKVYTWNDSGKADQPVLFYLHGGAYVFAGAPAHFHSVDDIAKQSGAKVVYPDYFRMPKYNYKESYPPVIELYKDVSDSVQDPEQITLMGDSAGGSYVLGLLDHIEHSNHLASPKQVISLSPWLDIALKNSVTKEFEKRDPMLEIDPIRDIGIRYWVSNMDDLEDPRASPMYSDLDFSVPIHLYTGTREVLFPDIVNFAERLSRKGKEFNLTIGKEMLHVYPIFPIPEGKEAREQIAQLI